MGSEFNEKAAYTGKSSMALGVFVIALMFQMQTAIRHQSLHNAASPLTWPLLGLVAAVSFACFCWYGVNAMRALK